MKAPAALAIMLLAAVAPVTPAAESSMSAGPCATAATRQLRAWGATAPPRDQPAADSRHWPTRTVGTWVTETGAPAVLLRVSPTHVTRLTWDGACRPRREEWPRPATAAPRFSDADLTALVSSGRSGVLYVWSPHMPLSVDGYQALAAAASARGLTVHAMLDPQADRAFAEASLERGRLPREALRVADSVELWYRDVHLHTPVILAYAKGRIEGDAWPGYHSADEYGSYLDRALARR